MRVAITTSAEAAPRVAAAFADYGFTPVHLPCIEVEAAAPEVLARLREEAGSADWLLLTSARAVAVVWPQGGMPPTPAAVVGGGTARAVVAAGGSVALEGEAGVDDLLSRLEAADAGGRLVFPHAAGTRRATLEQLDAAGWRLTAVVAYETIPVPPGDDPVEAAAFASPSAVQGWFAARDLDGLLVGAIGATTTASLAARGRPPDVTPERPGYQRLAEAMAAYAGVSTSPEHRRSQ